MSTTAQKPDSALDEAVYSRERELLREVRAAEGERLFDIYTQLALLFKDHVRELGYLDLMEQCARELKSPQRVATALFMRLEYYSICDDTGRFSDYADRVRHFMLEHGDKRSANVEALIIKRHIDEGRHQTALLAAREMLDRAGKKEDRYPEAYAYLSIGNAYASGGQYAEAVEAYEKSDAMMRLLEEQIPAIDRIRVGLELVDAARNTSDYVRSLHYCDTTLDRLDAYMAEEGTEEQRDVNCRSMHLYILCCYVRNFVELRQFDQAANYLRRAEADLYPHIGLDGEFFNETCAAYYQATGRYAKALPYAQRSVEAFCGKDLLPYYLSALKLKTEILAGTGAWEEAYTNMQYIERVKDSLASNRFVMQLGELHALYEFDKIEAQKARQRMIIIFTGLGCFLLTIIVGIYVVYSHRLRSKNRSLYHQIQENKRNEDKAARVLRMTSEADLSREMQLFRRLVRMMEEEHPFVNPAFGRTSLVKLLSTNDKYLADAVREGAGVTVATYISDWRLSYSLQMLAETPELTIEQIAEQSGHGAYSSFFRAFTRKYSMTPSDYRRFLLRKGSLE